MGAWRGCWAARIASPFRQYLGGVLVVELMRNPLIFFPLWLLYNEDIAGDGQGWGRFFPYETWSEEIKLIPLGQHHWGSGLWKEQRCMGLSVLQPHLKKAAWQKQEHQWCCVQHLSLYHTVLPRGLMPYISVMRSIKAQKTWEDKEENPLGRAVKLTLATLTPIVFWCIASGLPNPGAGRDLCLCIRKLLGSLFRHK